ncbi:outer membrane beta-barrel protein [Arenimonas sp.]|uniref:outer membrane beta-barrel protein n=1 Tax=Arenimonas sp. TaxID=1872635 RepID=UPI0035B0D6DD
MLQVAAALALGAPLAAGAQEPDFTYLEAGIIGGFVNDVEDSGTITGGGGSTQLETDAGGGGFIGGAWQFSENLHVFGEYSSAGQDLEVSDGVTTVEGDFSVVRWRVGVGYAYPVSSTVGFYGRLSYDGIELKDVEVSGFDLSADIDEDGIGGEVGMTWEATPAVQLQGHLRYTSVGEIASEGQDAFDADVLVGVTGRWNVRPDIALFTGYEYGKITTFNVGVRFSF